MTIDLLLTKLTVRLRDIDTNNPVGTGVIYYEKEYKDKVYILTASHCLYKDADNFEHIRTSIYVDIYSSRLNNYETITCQINPLLQFNDIDKDVALIVCDKTEIENISGKLNSVKVIKEKGKNDKFILKGFPEATEGQEIVVINPSWLQTAPITNKFQLQMSEDYTEDSMFGFSGSGVFANTGSHIYLIGILTRFRPEEKGKVLYCQYIDSINELLIRAFLPTVTYSYFADNNLNDDFFSQHVKKAIINLGPRFNEKLNVKLPISKIFNNVTKDEIFKKRITATVDKWLTFSTYCKTNQEKLNELNSKLEITKKECSKWFNSINLTDTNVIDFSQFITELTLLNSELYTLRDELYDKQSEEIRLNSKNKRYEYNKPYSEEIYWIRKTAENNDDFIFRLSEDVNINLANNPTLLIKGEAGSGKSHLLGDIATLRISNSLPTLLFLGQTFSAHKTIEENILNNLGLSCTYIELLESLDSIGLQIGSRVLILVDAINEGPGKELWNAQIAGFLHELLKYKFIAIAFTIRDTYYHNIIPDNLKGQSWITEVTHEGFKGNEYAALHLFCEHYGLKQPSFPILTPEFSKPLFLQVICEAVELLPDKSFPLGFIGATTIFNTYIKAVINKIESKRSEYQNKGIIKKAIEYLTSILYEQEYRSIGTTIIGELFDNKFPLYVNLLSDLIQENVLIKNYNSHNDLDIIYFAYERIGDFLITNKLFDAYNKASVLAEFKRDGKFGEKFTSEWRNEGILDAMAIVLPEKFKIEFFEVYQWLYEDGNDNNESHIDYWRVHNMMHRVLDSLSWRNPQDINNDRITQWINAVGKRYNFWTELLYKLVELSCIHNHPFNSDRLLNILTHLNMPERDALLQQHFRGYYGYNDAGNAFPITRLIDWAWLPNISALTDTETIRLAGQTLTWFLSSTMRRLRDQTTKALVNLLEEQPNALLQILERFKNIDDQYISERLYAVAYGCILRTTNKNAINLIAQYIYNEIFKDRNPPVNLLLRDYARNIIEYAVHLKADINININFARPPYKSKVPFLPTKEFVDRYKMDNESADFGKNYGQENNWVHFSTTNYDFYSKTLEPALHQFNPISFTEAPKILKHYKGLTKLQRGYLDTLCTYLFTKEKIKKNIFFHNSDKATQDKFVEIADRLLNDIDWYFKNARQKQYIINKTIPLLLNKRRGKSQFSDYKKIENIENWIVDKVFKLGYKSTIHGEYDSMVGRFSTHTSVERISEKYQNIALYEILAIITDNYKLKSNWSSINSQFYNGPWQLFMRDIDPAFISNKTRQEDREDYENEFAYKSTAWWEDVEYQYWNQSDLDWLRNINDIPSIQHTIIRTDENSEDWLSLNSYISWASPKVLGEEKYSGGTKHIKYDIVSYLVLKKDKNKIINYLNSEDHWDTRTSHSSITGLFNGERFWAPIYLEENEEDWYKIKKLNLKYGNTSVQAVGEMSEDKSEVHFQYYMPSKIIFEGMGLKFSKNEGDFLSQDGEMVATNINPKSILIKKDRLIDFLNANKMDIIWIVLVDKNIRTNMVGAHRYKDRRGVYYFEDNKLVGNLREIKDYEL